VYKTSPDSATPSLSSPYCQPSSSPLQLYFLSFPAPYTPQLHPCDQPLVHPPSYCSVLFYFEAGYSIHSSSENAFFFLSRRLPLPLLLLLCALDNWFLYRPNQTSTAYSFASCVVPSKFPLQTSLPGRSVVFPFQDFCPDHLFTSWMGFPLFRPVWHSSDGLSVGSLFLAVRGFFFHSSCVLAYFFACFPLPLWSLA